MKSAFEPQSQEHPARDEAAPPPEAPHIGHRCVVVTGAIASGKTTWLKRVAETLSRRYRIAGALCEARDERIYRSRTPAKAYDFLLWPGQDRFPWARRVNGIFEFDWENLDRVVHRLQAADCAEIFFLDDVGPLELGGGAWDGEIRRILNRDDGFLIMAVKKRCLPEVLAHYGLSAECPVFDLDECHDMDAMVSEVRALLEHRDARQIAAFSVVSGLTEVGMGSVLHAARVPFKGHFLALLQVLMLILFGRRLHGRGLYQIAFISALLKSFSPAGPRLRPMFYIFTQGALFTLPNSLMGWHFPAVLTGSLLTSLSTLFLSLGFALMTYGTAYFSMMENAFNQVLGAVGWGPYPLFTMIGWFVMIKLVLATLVAVAGFFGRFGFIERRVARVRGQAPVMPHAAALPESEKRTWRKSALGAMRDMGRLRFLIPFAITIAMILGFADLGPQQIYVVLLRALMVTWLGFMILRRVNPLSLVRFFRQRGARRFAVALDHSLATWQAQRQKGEDVD